MAKVNIDKSVLAADSSIGSFGLTLDGRVPRLDTASLGALHASGFRGQKYIETLDGIPDVSASSAAANYAAMLEILNDLAPTGGRVIIKNGAHFRQGFTVSSPIILEGNGPAEKVTFHPDTANDIFFFWDRRPAQGTDRDNSEQHLEATGGVNLWLESNRAQRADCFKMLGCDHGVMENVTVYGFKGSAWEAQRVREFQVRGFITRYCGYADPINPANHRHALIVASTFGPATDTANLNHWEGVQLTFSLGPELLIDGSPRNGFDSFLIHSLPRANTSYEGIVVSQYGGQSGWDASGNPRNEYAGLHVGAPSVANVSGRRWGRGGAACTPVTVRGDGRSTRFDQGVIIGHGGTNLVRADGVQTVVQMGQTDIDSAGTGIYTCTVAQGSDTFTVSSVTSGALEYLPETGTVVYMNAGSPSPLPIMGGRKVYLIRLSDTTFKLAATRADALAGTGITVTAATPGQTTPIQFYMGGELVYATGGSVITLTGHANYDDARVVAASDELSVVSKTAPVKYGQAFTSGPQLPTNEGEVKLFEARNVNMNSTADVAMLKTAMGHQYHVTKVVVHRVSGGSATNNAVGGIYTQAAKAGTVVLAAATAYSGLTAQYGLQTADPAATGRLSAAPLYWSLTTSAGSDIFADVFVYGRVID